MEDINETIEQQFKNVFDEFNNISKRTKDLQETLRILQKTCKNAEKQVKAQKKKVQVPLNLSNDLEKFLGVKKGTQLTKAEVMRGVSEYIKTNDLQIKDDRRKFKPNKQLNKIFGMNIADSFTFVEINKHVSGHLTK
jgi:chromatin remodeling complex protein RSC6|tara:strand:- start:979 stop:1389 length:411 start_codon:yes stop_codon:yes gene_type:complete